MIRNKKKIGEKMLTSIEICAGAGGQALGLEMAGFSHIAFSRNMKKKYCENAQKKIARSGMYLRRCS